MTNSIFRTALVFVWIPFVVTAQPRPGQYVAFYGGDGTPYPLYAGEFGNSPSWTSSRLQLIGTNFDGFYGNPGFSMSEANTLRAFKPNFQLVTYKGGWAINDYADAEANHRGDILYYREGNLAAALSATDTNLTLTGALGTLIPGTASLGNTISYKTGGVMYYVTWVRINGEYMRILAVNGNTVTVQRGFAGTAPAAHGADSPVLAPCYGTAPDPGTGTSIKYRHDPGKSYRWDGLLAEALSEHNANGGGIWIDIVTGNLSVNDMSGASVSMSRRWDDLTQNGYTDSNWDRYAEIGVKLIQDGFLASKGIYPVIWGNNLLHPTNPTDNRLKLLQPTDDKPRPMDGFAQENSYGGYGSNGGSGDVFSWTDFSGWKDHLRSIMFMGEQRVSARPLMLDGGADNVNFADEPEAFRDQVLLFGYCSYLMAVKVEADDRIYTMIGFTPVVGPNNSSQRTVELPPWFQWDIGRPVETRASANHLGYQLPGKSTFQRRFENGIVLVNAADSGSETITLDQTYLNPLTSNLVSQVTMTNKTGVILLYASLPPATPANLVAVAIDTNRIQLSWTDTSVNELGFEIQRATNAAGPWSLIFMVGSNVTAVVDSNLLAATTYFYSVRATNDAGVSDWSATNSATTFAPGTTTFSNLDLIMPASLWKPATNPTPPSAAAVINFSSATNLSWVWDDTSGTNATLTYTITRSDTSGPGGADVYFFGGAMFTGTVTSLRLAMDVAKSGNNIGTLRFALRQGTNLFQTSSGLNNLPGDTGPIVNYELTGLMTLSLLTNGVEALAGLTWVPRYVGTTLEFTNGLPLEFGFRSDAGLGGSATTTQRGPQLDNYLVEIAGQSAPPKPPLLSLESAGAGQWQLNWDASAFTLQEAPTLTGLWTNLMPQPSSPFPINSTGPAGFYRLQWTAP